MIKIDLHTHSSASVDGGISLDQYRHILTQNLLDVVAITDHNTVDVATLLHKEFPHRIIVGEEITTLKGDIIGLFLHKPIPSGLTIIEAAKGIKSQGGLVYIPHPFETIRSGVQVADLDSIEDVIDIVEVHNGRARFQNKSEEARAWAKKHNKAVAASSDAHSLSGLGTVFSSINSLPTEATLVEELTRATLVNVHPPIYSLAAPKFHRLRKRLGQKQK